MSRWIIAFPLAFVVAVALFSFMAWMVTDDGHTTPKASDNLRFDLFMNQTHEHVQRRQRILPKPPKAVPAPPTSTPMSVGAPNTQVSPQALPSPSFAAAGISSSIDGISINAPTLGGMGGNQQALPIYREKPRYPMVALKRKLEGYVVLKFNIDKQGRPTDISVVEAKPKRIFDRNALLALRNWKYQPKIVDGNPVVQVGFVQKIDFKISK
ncbi:energy transducer TonB [Vibrio marisflavi]|uniref:Protein TonB n=1 Tax=Vibrio marisflavi CECT 7928 TaxID=634439 RepID=A0ABN8E506_9VIBR|nr:energy transducer TonB [Vibrio marisflavi]CAH0539658.1 hypothetical protein VMF7928_02335 [Vibrio marisflavi CECT 7928]